MTTDPSGLRRDYRERTLSEEEAGSDPIALFGRWFVEAVDHPVDEPNAMALATATAEGVPSVRMVLLKGWDERGFVFYTNHESRKGGELAGNPRAELAFWWGPMERQVRIGGDVERVEHATSLAYFESRPRGSRLGAWASPQSRVIADREQLDERMEELEQRYDDDIPMPPFWGGYRVRPQSMEFWQGRTGRLHDRVRFRRDGSVWVLERLAP